MLYRTAVLFLVLSLPSACLASDIGLPTLTGDYEIWPDAAPSGRSAQFEFPTDIQSVEGLRSIVTGAWAAGELVCSNVVGPPDTSSFFPGLSMYLSSAEGFEGYYHATVLPVAGEFTIVSDLFDYSGTGDLGQLLGAVISVELFCDLVLPLSCSVTKS